MVGAFLRLRHLGAKSFWVDEAFSAVLAAAPWHNFWQQIQSAELNMPPYCRHFRVPARPIRILDDTSKSRFGWTSVIF